MSVSKINDENLDIEALACELIMILTADYPGMLGNKYSVDEAIARPADDDPSMDDHLNPGIARAAALLEETAVSRKLLRSGGIPDTSRAARLLLDDLRSGRIGRISLERVL